MNRARAGRGVLPGGDPPEPSRDSAKLRAYLNADAAPKAPRRVVKARAFPFHPSRQPHPTHPLPVCPAHRRRRRRRRRPRTHRRTFLVRAASDQPETPASVPPPVQTASEVAAGRVSPRRGHRPSPLAGHGDEAIIERGARVGQRRRRRQRERGGAADVRPAVGGGAAGGGADAGAGTRRALHPRGASRLRPPPLALRLLPHPPRLRISGDHE